VALGAGFRPEGVERARLLYDGERFDTETHSRLATDQV
jgi:RimJ/RimL family protein N-acetyltransferase